MPIAVTHTAATGVSASNSFLFMTFPFVVRLAAFAAGPIPSARCPQLLGNACPSMVHSRFVTEATTDWSQNWQASDTPLPLNLSAPVLRQFTTGPVGPCTAHPPGLRSESGPRAAPPAQNTEPPARDVCWC